MESEKVIAFDLTQKEWGRINENYSDFKKIFEEVGFQPEIYIEFPLRYESLKKCAIFVILCPDSSKLRKQEINAIIEFVSEGGILIIFSSAGGDKGRRTNLNELLENFNLSIVNNEVMDHSSNLGINSYVLLSENGSKFLFNKVNEFCFRCGCSLESSNSYDVVLKSNDSSIPSNQPIMIFSKFRKGAIFLSGTYESFRDDLKGGIEHEPNRIFARELAKYLFNFNKNGKHELKNPNFKVSSLNNKTITISKNDFISNSENTFLERQLMNKIINLEHEIAEINKENELFKIQYQKMYEEVSENFKDFQLEHVEMLKDDFNMNFDEILTNLDLKVNNLTSKLLIFENKFEDIAKEIKDYNIRAEELDTLLGNLVFKIHDIEEKLNQNDEFIEISKKEELDDNKSLQKGLIFNSENLDKKLEEDTSNPEEKLRNYYKLRNNLIEKYKSGEFDKEKFEIDLQNIQNKIEYYKGILIQ